MVLPRGHRGDFCSSVNARRQHQLLCYTIEGLNSFGTVLYFTYLYFLLHEKFGFGDMANLAVAALLGLVYAVAAWQGGKFGQRHGNFAALKLGFGLMGISYVIASQLPTAAGQILGAALVSLGMCFTWPVLEALISEGERPDHIPHAVGIYNITWAWTNALALFIGGTIIEKFGYASIYWLPLGIVLVQLALTVRLEKIQVPPENGTAAPPPDPHRPSPARAKNFQQLAWLANPFAYIAINTLIAVLPGVAAKFQLTPMFAGFACSLWGFARLAAFIVLWRWPGWHYRFRWLAAAYALLILSFALILVVPALPVVLAAQVFFGAAIGLIYYSSLFYAMDASDTKSEHGGIHEAAIGIGNCLGPATGAAALWLAPQNPGTGVWAVTGLLALGFGGLLWVRKIR
jgi:predicted MFS family arabinose efflux permease